MFTDLHSQFPSYLAWNSTAVPVIIIALVLSRDYFRRLLSDGYLTIICGPANRIRSQTAIYEGAFHRCNLVAVFYRTFRPSITISLRDLREKMWFNDDLKLNRRSSLCPTSTSLTEDFTAASCFAKLRNQFPSKNVGRFCTSIITSL